MSQTRVFFTSDVHGSEICFLKFLSAAKFYKANVLVLGGDITGKMVIPIVERSDGTFVAEYFGSEQTMKTHEQREALEKRIRIGGHYPYRTTPEGLESLQNDPKAVDELFSKLMVDGIRRWVSIAEERLKGTDVKCYISPGNDDRFDIDEVLKSSSAIDCPEDNVVWLDDHHEMITSAWTNVSPWHSPRETTEDKLLDIFGRMISKVQRMENCIFSLHCPPFDTPIDLAPELDEKLKPVTRGGNFSMIHVGSTAVKEVIAKYRPLLGLHGHIHESNGFVKIDRTLCINPGSAYRDGMLRGAVVEIDENGVRNYLLTQG